MGKEGYCFGSTTLSGFEHDANPKDIRKKKNIKMSATKMKALLTHRKKISHLEEIIKIMYF